MDDITVIGGGLAGLIAAIECAEASDGAARVRLLEARRRLGGRGASTPGPFVANLGPHALYTGTALWDWLAARGLHRPYRRPRSPAVRFRQGGRVRRTPPPALLRAGLLRAEAPVDTDLRSWLGERWDGADVEALCGLAGVLTFDHDPGRLSAAFVWERVRRILVAVPPVARYVTGGWGQLVGRLAEAARARGVRIEAGARVDALDDVRGGPVIVATEPGAARRLLGDDRLRVTTPRVGLLDLGLVRRAGDPYLVLDADEAGFADRFTAVDRTLAPEGRELVQVSMGLRPGEELAAGVGRIERLLDASFTGWRDREVWRRRAAVTESTGAVELPGATWRDRPPVTYGDGVWLAGDWVASPGHLAETACTSAVTAAAGAVRALRATRPSEVA